MIGTIIRQRYRLDVEIGRGGFGVVYQARDLLLNRDVAIKLLHEAQGASASERLLHEARAVAQLSHPNIVNIYDAGTLSPTEGFNKKETTFIVMEWVQGTPLSACQLPLSLEQTLSIARQVCAALQHAHEHGIIHRDLKPENITLMPDGRSRLMDFGLAHSLTSRLTSQGMIIGTVFYLAPEQALGGSLDGRTDLYALGVLLYEILTGRLPFTGSDPLAVITQHLHAPPVPPRAHNAAIPPVLEALVMRLLAKQPDDRPESASEVLQALDDIQASVVTPIAVQPATPQPLERIVRGRMVGRQFELAEMTTCWQRALTKQSEEIVLLLSGEPGVGKTRLLKEMITRARVSGAVILLGECYAESGAPYAPFAAIIRQGLAAIQESGDLPEPVLADLVELAPDQRSKYPHLLPNPSLDPQSAQQRVYESVVTLCNTLVKHHPLLLTLDDVHWADAGSLALLRYLARRLRQENLPALMIVAYREVELDEARPWHETLLELNRERLATRFKLARFDRQGTNDLLALLFQEDITPEFLEGIYQETEGNPFYVEEVCKALIEEGKIYFQDGHWQRPPMTEIIIPQSVRIAIQSRLARLPVSAQDIVRLAAFLGREFDYAVLQQAVQSQPEGGINDDLLVEALEAAELAQLINELPVGHGDQVQRAGNIRFAFVHALIPATLREGVSGMRRQRMHRRAAVALQTLRPTEYEAIATHLEQGNELDLARSYYKKAGDRALSVYANADAERHFRAALELDGTPTERATLTAGLAQSLHQQSRLPESLQAWLEAADLYRLAQDDDGLPYAYAHAAILARISGDTARGTIIVQQGLAVVEGHPETPGYATLLGTQIYLLAATGGSREDLLALSQHALRVAERVGNTEAQAEILNGIGYTLRELNRYEDAMAAYTQAIQIAEEHDFWRAADVAHNYLAQLLIELGETHGCIQHCLRAAEIARRSGSVYDEVFNLAYLTCLYTYRGEITQAKEMNTRYETLLKFIETTGPAWHVSTIGRALLWHMQGQSNKGLALLDESIAKAASQGDQGYQITSGEVRGLILLDLEKWEEATQALTHTNQVADSSFGGDETVKALLAVSCTHLGRLEESRRLTAHASSLAGKTSSFMAHFAIAQAQAHLAWAEGDWPRAWEAFEQAARLVKQFGFRWYQGFLQRNWAEAYLARGEVGDFIRARQLLEQTLELYQSCSMTSHAKRVQARLENLTLTQPPPSENHR